MLDHLLYDHGFKGDPKEVLYEIVKRHVIPYLGEKVEFEKWMNTSHNPIRAIRVNGIEVIHESTSCNNPTITPEIVGVDEETILVVAREVGSFDEKDANIPRHYQHECQRFSTNP